MLKIRSEKEFCAGLLYLGIAGLFLWFGRDYRLGSAAKMGPGYFPFYLSLGLAVLGAVAVVRGFLVEGERAGAIAWKPLLLVLSGCLAFGLLLNRAGLVFALLALCLLSAGASAYFRLSGKAMLGLLVLTAFCTVIFVKGLGVPMPILGDWFGENLPNWLVR